MINPTDYRRITGISCLDLNIGCASQQISDIFITKALCCRLNSTVKLTRGKIFKQSLQMYTILLKKPLKQHTADIIFFI